MGDGRVRLHHDVRVWRIDETVKLETHVARRTGPVLGPKSAGVAKDVFGVVHSRADVIDGQGARRVVNSVVKSTARLLVRGHNNVRAAWRGVTAGAGTLERCKDIVVRHLGRRDERAEKKERCRCACGGGDGLAHGLVAAAQL